MIKLFSFQFEEWLRGVQFFFLIDLFSIVKKAFFIQDFWDGLHEKKSLDSAYSLTDVLNFSNLQFLCHKAVMYL